MPTAPLLNQFQYTYERDTVTIYGSAVTADNFCNIASFQGGGIESISVTEPFVTASFTGQVDGMTTDVTIIADTPGTPGNTITLTGDGLSDISSLLSAWNIANPSNTATVTDGDDSQIPDNLAIIQLSGGSNGTPGQFSVVLSDVFNKLLEAEVAIVKLSVSNTLDIQLNMSASDAQTAVRTGDALLFQCTNGGDIVPTAGTGLMFRIVCRNTSLNAPNG